jgi:hypothetical protein
MTPHAPLSGRDTAAAFKGLVVGFVAVAVIVLTIVYLTNQKFAGHAATPAAESTH